MCYGPLDVISGLWVEVQGVWDRGSPVEGSLGLGLRAGFETLTNHWVSRVELGGFRGSELS